MMKYRLFANSAIGMFSIVSLDTGNQYFGKLVFPKERKNSSETFTAHLSSCRSLYISIIVYFLN